MIAIFKLLNGEGKVVINFYCRQFTLSVFVSKEKWIETVGGREQVQGKDVERVLYSNNFKDVGSLPYAAALAVTVDTF